jgi:acyl carrier protein
MTPNEIREAVLQALVDVAPEADPSTLRPDVDLRDQLDIDSMDFLNFVIAVHEELHVDIPESDYDRLRTLDDVVAYVLEQSPVSP